jgi:hypothetical protein
MRPSDNDLRVWERTLGALTEEMETHAWREDPNLHQPDYIPLVRIAWKAVKDEQQTRRDSVVAPFGQEPKSDVMPDGWHEENGWTQVNDVEGPLDRCPKCTDEMEKQPYDCCGLVGGCGGPCAAFPCWGLTT